MKKGTKITLIIFAILVALVAGAMLSMDIVCTKIAKKQIAQQMADKPFDIDLKMIHLMPLSQSADVLGITLTKEDEKYPLTIGIAQVKVHHVDIRRALRQRSVSLDKITIDGLNIQMTVPHPEGKMELYMENTDLCVHHLCYNSGADSTLQTGLLIDSITTHTDSLYVHLIKQHAPTKPYGTPQDALGNLPTEMHIAHVTNKIEKMGFGLTTELVPYGSIRLYRIVNQASNINGDKGNHMLLQALAHLEHGGVAYLNTTFVQNKNQDVNLDFLVIGGQGSPVDEMTRPLVGITFACDIDTLRAKAKGNKNTLDGTFVMRYHGLEVFIHPGESPYEIINKNAQFIGSVANTLIPKANPNPLTPDNVRRYNVHAERDPMKAYPNYMMGPIIDGLKSTMLPGLFINKKIKTTPKTQTNAQSATKTKTE